MSELEKFNQMSDAEKIQLMKVYEMFSAVTQSTQLEKKIDPECALSEVSKVFNKSPAKQKTLDSWLVKSKSALSPIMSKNASPKQTENASSPVHSKNISPVNSKNVSPVQSKSASVDQRKETVHNHEMSPKPGTSTEAAQAEDDLFTNGESLNILQNSEKVSAKIGHSSIPSSGEFCQIRPLHTDLERKKGNFDPIVVIERLDLNKINRGNALPEISNPTVVAVSKPEKEKVIENAQERVQSPVILSPSRNLKRKKKCATEVPDSPACSYTQPSKCKEVKPLEEDGEESNTSVESVQKRSLRSTRQSSNSSNSSNEKQANVKTRSHVTRSSDQESERTQLCEKPGDEFVEVGFGDKEVFLFSDQSKSNANENFIGTTADKFKSPSSKSKLKCKSNRKKDQQLSDTEGNIHNTVIQKDSIKEVIKLPIKQSPKKKDIVNTDVVATFLDTSKSLPDYNLKNKCSELQKAKSAVKNPEVKISNSDTTVLSSGSDSENLEENNQVKDKKRGLRKSKKTCLSSVLPKPCLKIETVLKQNLKKKQPDANDSKLSINTVEKSCSEKETCNTEQCNMEKAEDDNLIGELSKQGLSLKSVSKGKLKITCKKSKEKLPNVDQMSDEEHKLNTVTENNSELSAKHLKNIKSKKKCHLPLTVDSEIIYADEQAVSNANSNLGGGCTDLTTDDTNCQKRMSCEKGSDSAIQQISDKNLKSGNKKSPKKSFKTRKEHSEKTNTNKIEPTIQVSSPNKKVIISLEQTSTHEVTNLQSNVNQKKRKKTDDTVLNSKIIDSKNTTLKTAVPTDDAKVDFLSPEIKPKRILKKRTNKRLESSGSTVSCANSVSSVSSDDQSIQALDDKVIKQIIKTSENEVSENNMEVSESKVESSVLSSNGDKKEKNSVKISKTVGKLKKRLYPNNNNVTSSENFGSCAIIDAESNAKQSETEEHAQPASSSKSVKEKSAIKTKSKRTGKKKLSENNSSVKDSAFCSSEENITDDTVNNTLNTKVVISADKSEFKLNDRNSVELVSENNNKKNEMVENVPSVSTSKSVVKRRQKRKKLCKIEGQSANLESSTLAASAGNLFQENGIHSADSSELINNAESVNIVPTDKSKCTKISQDESTSASVSSQDSTESSVNDNQTVTKKQFNYEAYCKLSRICSSHGVVLDDIFRKKEFKEMIEKYRNNPGAIVFIGTHKCPTTGKVEPTVNVHKSKKQLLEILSTVQVKNNTNVSVKEDK